jgi:hypothetical protein
MDTFQPPAIEGELDAQPKPLMIHTVSLPGLSYLISPHLPPPNSHLQMTSGSLHASPLLRSRKFNILSISPYNRHRFFLRSCFQSQHRTKRLRSSGSEDGPETCSFAFIGMMDVMDGDVVWSTSHSYARESEPLLWYGHVVDVSRWSFCARKCSNPYDLALVS